MHNLPTSFPGGSKAIRQSSNANFTRLDTIKTTNIHKIPAHF
jgi:hypothetical protein